VRVRHLRKFRCGSGGSGLHRPHVHRCRDPAGVLECRSSDVFAGFQIVRKPYQHDVVAAGANARDPCAGSRARRRASFVAMVVTLMDRAVRRTARPVTARYLSNLLAERHSHDRSKTTPVSIAGRDHGLGNADGPAARRGMRHARKQRCEHECRYERCAIRRITTMLAASARRVRGRCPL